MTPNTPPLPTKPPGQALSNGSSMADAAPVLNTLEKHKTQVLDLAVQVYQRDASLRAGPESESDGSGMSPTAAIGRTLRGSYHVLLQLSIDGTPRYLLKVPMTGTTELWDSVCERSLKSEAQTMMLLSSRICVPKVHDYSATLDNAIGCPYIVISFVDGLPLYDVWFGHQLHPNTISAEATRNHRIRALDGISAAMIQLGRFSFSKSGAPNYDDDGALAGIGASRFVKDELDQVPSSSTDPAPERELPAPQPPSQSPRVLVTLKRGLSAVAHSVTWVASHLISMTRLRRSAGQHGPNGTNSVPATDSPKPTMPRGSQDNDTEEIAEDEAQEATPTEYVEWGPTTDPEKFYTRVIDNLKRGNNKYNVGVLTLLRMFISWIPEPSPDPSDPTSLVLKGFPFVLCHPDFDIQNFIVSADGTLKAIIDWDNVEAVPRSVGNEALPGWLTRDWDPVFYAYQGKMDDEEALRSGYEPDTLWEDSETTLQEYRRIYAILIAKHKTNNLRKVNSNGSVQQRPQLKRQVSRTTRQSLLALNLQAAAFNSVSRSRVLDKIISEMWEAYREAYSGADSPASDDGAESESDSESLQPEAEAQSAGVYEPESDSEYERDLRSDVYPSFGTIMDLYVHDELDDVLLERLEVAFRALLQKLDDL